ncbi:MAG: CoA binding protein [Dehalococcoidia bacterium]|nr:CoA binding protein [Dehalococcoidia bacterium]
MQFNVGISIKEDVFSAIFSPRSIAVIGASANGENIGANYFRALVRAGFTGKLYPVSQGGGHLLGYQVYRDLRALPEGPDYCIVAVPASSVPDVIDSCVERKVKVVQIYTAGFAEMGTDGAHLQSEVVRRAREGDVRIIGPNCMGICSPGARIPFGTMDKIAETGPVAFLSQSGGLTGDMILLGLERGIRFSKVVSFGNGCDLDIHQFLDFLSGDNETGIIGAYVEDVRDGRRLMQQLRALRGKKPVVLCKGGMTEPGTRATMSHTGSLTLSPQRWSGALAQAGAISVDSLEALADMVLIFQQLPYHFGRRVALVSGLSGGGGGIGVIASDTCSRAGLVVPQFSLETQDKLQRLLPQVGVIVQNPLDLGGKSSNAELLESCLHICAGEPQVDILMVDLHVGKLADVAGEQQVRNISLLLTKVAQSLSKPMIVVAKPGLAPHLCLEIQQYLAQNGLAVFPSIGQAARALALLNVWKELSLP